MKARDPRDPSPDSHPGEQPATVNELELLLTAVQMTLSTGSTGVSRTYFSLET